MIKTDAAPTTNMSLLDSIRRRRTTNGTFLPDPVSPEHQRLLMDAAGRAPSHFNSQPWRFVLIDNREMIEQLGRLNGTSMTKIMGEGTFFKRYREYFDLSKNSDRGDGIHIDKVPQVFRPFVRYLFSEWAVVLFNALGVPRILGRSNQNLVSGSPLLLATLATRKEYRPGELSGEYSTMSLAMALENIWLTITALGMGIQFMSFAKEDTQAWQEVHNILRVPDDLALFQVYRLGYVPQDEQRPTIDWTSGHRKPVGEYVFRNTCKEPYKELESVRSLLYEPKEESIGSVNGQHAGGGDRSHGCL